MPANMTKAGIKYKKGGAKKKSKNWIKDPIPIQSDPVLCTSADSTS